MIQQKASTNADSGSDSLAIGIIGAGRMGRHHFNAVTNYGGRVVAVHDVRLAAAQELATVANAELATDVLNDFFHVELDGVVITTPIGVNLRIFNILQKSKSCVFANASYPPIIIEYSLFYIPKSSA